LTLRWRLEILSQSWSLQRKAGDLASLKGIKDNDNDPKHTSRLANKWFTENKVENSNGPLSPDLDTIEHLWDELDRSVAKFCRKSIAEFRKGLYECWEQIGK
jgi:hypothetical protein